MVWSVFSMVLGGFGGRENYFFEFLCQWCCLFFYLDCFSISELCCFAIPCFIFLPRRRASFSVSSLLESRLSISSSFRAWFHMACLAISLHLISECFFMILWRSSGIARVMFVIECSFLSIICVFTYIRFLSCSAYKGLMDISQMFCYRFQRGDLFIAFCLLSLLLVCKKEDARRLVPFLQLFEEVF